MREPRETKKEKGGKIKSQEEKEKQKKPEKKTPRKKEATGVEPVTYRTAADCSTTELYLQIEEPVCALETEFYNIYRLYFHCTNSTLDFICSIFLLPTVCFVFSFLGLAYQGKGIVFRFIIEYILVASWILAPW